MECSQETLSNNNGIDNTDRLSHSNISSAENGIAEDNNNKIEIETSLERKDNSSDDDDDDDVEPKLTYDRIGNDVANVMKTDTATCLTFYERFFALGTQRGKIYIFDFQGNLVTNREINMHKSPINQISIDDKGEYIGSCSDYRVVVTELYTNESNYVSNFDRPVKTLCLDPNYASFSSRRFAIGEADRLLLYEKNILARYKSNCLQQARGVIRTTTWRTHFIAWASDLCIKIYDVQGKCIITHIDREKETDYRIKSDLFQCSFCWKDNLTLLTAWGNSIKMCCIKPKTHESELSLTSVSNLDRLPKYYVELVFAFNIEDNLTACGIAPIENRLMIMCTNKAILCPNIGNNSMDTKQICRIKMVEPLNADMFNDISDDILTPKEFLKTVTNSSDIGMAYLPGENFYFIFCPKDLILAKPREEDDHISWLMERGKFSDALTRIMSNGDRNNRCYKHSVESVGTMYIQHLFGQGSVAAFEEAAKLCITVCANNKSLWEREVIRFKQVGCLRIIANYLPIGPDTILQPALYELVLKEYLETDSAGFLNLIKDWPPNLYSTTTLIKATIDQLSSHSHDRNLLEALAELYTYECLYRKALFIFLQVGNSKKVFELIYSHQLLHLLEDRIVQLLQLDPEETSRLLIMHQDSIPSDKVISRLNDHPRLLCAYLDRLIHRDPTACASYHNLLFDLYSTYEPDKLVPLLRQSNYIQLDKALEVCKKKNLTHAIVFILGRMGNTREALRIIIDKMNDINAAIEFCKEHGDSDLWAELMDISVSNPQLLSTLLREVSTYAADPIGLITRIPEGHLVPDLMPSLVKILQDYRLQVTLEDGCCRVLHSDCFNLLSKLYRIRSRALTVRESSLCQGCQRTVLEYDHLYASDLVIFQCGHVFHQNCLLISDSQYGLYSLQDTEEAPIVLVNQTRWMRAYAYSLPKFDCVVLPALTLSSGAHNANNSNNIRQL